jgi:hypothetical protein
MPGFTKDTTPVTIETPVYQSREVQLGEFTCAFETVRADHDAAPAFKGLPNDRCPCPHWGLVVSGRMTLSYRDHDDTFEAGDVYYASPGHLPVMAAGTELITFSPTTELHEVMAVIARNSAAAAASRS